MVTGGTGSFGNAFVRRALAGQEWGRIVIFSRDELKQSEMRKAIPDPDVRLRFMVGDVRDQPRLRAAMRGVDVVIHAAALKQVDTAEYNPEEFVKTNVMGAMNIVDAARDNGVKKVLALSTDKACAPLNLYGATKLSAEKLFVSANASAPETMFSCVRYGNVTGSRGSVVPLWREVAKTGAPLGITDNRMTRFWMTLDGAVQFVLDCLGVMTGGQVFVPALDSYHITDLAHAVAPDAALMTIGIRPGEKLHESMISEDEALWAWKWAKGWAMIPEPTVDLAVKPPPGAVRVERGFSYTSETAPKLDADELMKRLKDVK